MTELDALTARIRGSGTFAELFDAGYDAFEVIRMVARACEDRTPELFAAFIVSAGTAVEGRNALNDAPSLPPARTGPRLPLAVSALTYTSEIAGELAVLAALLTRRLTDACAQAALPGDRVACHRAASAAAEIHQLLAQGSDETVTR